MVWTRMISPARPAATTSSRHSQSGPTNSFCAEPVCRTQNSRVIRRFPANEVAGTFDASAISPPNGELLTGILGCQTDALDPRTRLTRVVVRMEWLHIWNEKKRF